MKLYGVGLICRLLIVSLLLLSFQTARAGMIGTGEAVPAAGSQVERAQILGLLARGDVAKQLEVLGVDPNVARDRVATMSDEEVRSLAGNLGSVPAGGVSGWAIALIILVAVGVWWWWTNYRR